MKNNKLNILIAIGLVLMAGIARIVNHEMHLYNLEMVSPLALFCGAVVKDKRLAFLLPLLALFIGDIYISLFTKWQGFYGIEQVFVYGAMIVVTVFGTAMGQPKAVKVLGFAVAGSLLFFLVSNFGVWVSIEMGKVDLYGYGKGWDGLVTTYIKAIPFYEKGTLPGNLVGATILFGAYFLLQQALSDKTQKARA